LKGRIVCVWNCFIFFLGEYSSVSREICHVLSQIQSRFLRGISTKNYFGRIFHKFCENQGEYSSVWREIYRVLSQIQSRFLRGISKQNYFGIIFQKFCESQGYPLPKFVKFRPTFYKFFWDHSVLKKSEKIHTSTFICFCTLLRRHVHKQIAKRRYRDKNPRRFVYGKPIYSLSGLTMRYSPDILLWNYYQTFVIVCIEFRLRFELQICPTTFAITFIHHWQSWKEGLFVCETVWFFSYVNTHPFLVKFVTFCPKFSRDSYVEFQNKTIFGEFFINFVKTKAISSTKNLWNFVLLLQFFSRTILHWKIPKKIKNVLSYVLRTLLRRHVHKKKHKKEIGKKIHDVLFSKDRFCSLSVWDLLRLIPLVFWSEAFTRHVSFCVLSFPEFWVSNSSHKICNKFFIHHW